MYIHQTPLTLMLLAGLMASGPAAHATSKVIEMPDSTTITHADSEEGEFSFIHHIEEDVEHVILKAPQSSTAPITYTFDFRALNQKPEMVNALLVEQGFSTFEGSHHYNIITHDITGTNGFVFNNGVNLGENFALSIVGNQVESLTGVSVSGEVRAQNTLSVHAHAITDDSNPDSNSLSIIALDLYEATFDFKGKLDLSATSNQIDAYSGAIQANNSIVNLQSAGMSTIIGDISLEGENSELTLILSHGTDLFKGATEIKNGVLNLSLSNGARWQVTDDSAFTEFRWKKDGVVDLTDIGSNGILFGITGNHGAGEAVTFIEDGATLRIALTDELVADKDPNRYLLQLEEARAQGAENVRVNVEIIDNRTDKNEVNSMGVGVIRFDSVSEGNITLMSKPHEFETALGRFETIAEFGSGENNGYVLNDIRTDLVGPSNFANTQLDFISTELIAHENLALRAQHHLIDRALHAPEKGLWAQAHFGEMRFQYANDAREQTLQTQSLTLGYDRALEIPFMHETYAGLWATFAKNDVDMQAGSGDIDQYAVGLYAGGLSTEKNYRLLLTAHYGKADSHANAVAYFDNGTTSRMLDVAAKTDSYGAGLYMGFLNGYDPQASWSFEPFISGYTYWVNERETDPVAGVAFHAEKNHQSVAKLGVTLSYDGHETQPLSAWAQAAWAHRFGKSIDVEGISGDGYQTFETEDLQESWGELLLGAQYRMSNHLELGFRASAGLAHTVEPTFDISAHATYRFN